MEKSITTNKIISREDYYKLKSYQNLQKVILNFLDSIEQDALLITGEKDKFGKSYWGGITCDGIYSKTPDGIDDMLKRLNIEVEKENKIVEHKKEVGKVGKKKFKSGQWAKNKELNKSVEVIDHPSLHYHNFEFIDENGDSLFVGKKLSQEELDEIMKIGENIDKGEPAG